MRPHMVENPHLEPFLSGHQIIITLILLVLLASVFLRGFKEAIGVAAILVAITTAIAEVIANPSLWSNWTTALTQQHGNPLVIVAIALLVFSKLALGLSGFETGVAVMPLINSGPWRHSRASDRSHSRRQTY